VNSNDADVPKSDPFENNLPKTIILDANILIRAVLGKRVWHLLHSYLQTTVYLTPDIGFTDSRRHVPAILRERGLGAEATTYLELKLYIASTFSNISTSTGLTKC
jgi:PIN domain